jgi:hypothetical protein
VKPDHDSSPDCADRFQATRWSVVMLSAQSQAPGSQKALLASSAAGEQKVTRKWYGVETNLGTVWKTFVRTPLFAI